MNEEKTSISGRIIEVMEKQTFASGFEKQVIVVETGGEYPQTIPLEFLKDNCEKVNGLVKGDEVEVFYNLRGSEYNGRYYVNLVAWRVEKVENDPKAKNSPKTDQPSNYEVEDDDEIPF